MDKILKRDDFIILMEQKEYENLVSVNEGLLKNLFGVVKNLFKKDWATIKGDSQIIRVYKELDDNLSGFTMMKMSKKGECNKIRQELVDFACDWYDLKMNKAKEDGTDPKPAKSMKFKNDTLRENIESMEKRIKDIAGDDEQMLKWANALKEGMKTVINRSILEDMKDEDAKKELEAKIAEDMKKQEEINKVMEKWQNDQLKEIQSEREKLISNTKSTPIDANLSGDKAIQNFYDEFDKIKNDRKNAKASKKNTFDPLRKDTMLGFQSIFTDEDFKNKLFKTTYTILDVFYSSLNKNDVIKKFQEVPSQSVQAMCISINSFVKSSVYGDDSYKNTTLPLMAKCAVISDGIVSYNLPLNGKTGDDAGNYFTDIVGIISRQEFKKDTDNKDIIYPDDFKTNADKIFKEIIAEAKKLKEDSEKKYNKQLKSLKFD